MVNGTSFSAPLVAGAAALLYAAGESRPMPSEVKDEILKNRIETGPIPGDPDGIDEGVLNVAGF